MTLPRVLAKYELLEEVGKGGMSIVYRGLDTTLNREVAVKVLHEHLAGEEETRRRFQREAHAVAKLRHPNILEIFEYSGVEAPESYIVTEFIRGRTLKHFLQDHAIPLAEVAAMVVAQIGRAVGHAHAEGVIHRDIKPENIMIRSDGLLKLMDFGIAQIVDVKRLTVSGQLLGSPAYMAPEQIDGRPQDVRTDVFSLGTLLYELCTGELPFRGKNAHEILKRISEGVFADPEAISPALGDGLAKILRQALAHRPEDRYADVQAFMESLEAHLAEMGFADMDAELARFFAEPESYGADARRTLVERLIGLGRAQLAGGHTARALALLNRVLALDPDRSEVHALLDRLARRRRVGRSAGALLAIGLMAGALWAGVRALPRTQKPAAVAVASQAPPPARAPLPSSDPRTHIPSVRPAPQRAARRESTRIAPFPQRVSITLDDKYLGFYTGTLSVPLGKSHSLKLGDNPLCDTEEFAISPDESRAQVPLRLRCNARFRVDCGRVPGAVVRVTSRERKVSGTCGQELKIKMKGRSEPTTFTLQVEAPGYRAHVRQIPVTDLGLVHVPVVLEKAP